MTWPIEQRAAGEPDAPALSDERGTTTWAEVWDQLQRAASGLRAVVANHSGEEAKVAVVGENRRETLVVHAAAVLAGISSVPVAAALSTDEAAYIFKDSGAVAVFAGAATASRAVEAAKEAGVDQVVVAGDGDLEASVIRFAEWLQGSPPVPPDLTRRAQPMLYYTSGTTGRPKGVHMRALLEDDTVAGYLHHLIRSAEVMSFAGAPHLVVGPLHHTAPLGSLWALLAGAPVTILPKFDPERALEAIERDHIASSAMVPTHLVRFLKLPASVRSRYDVSSLRSIVLTGAACPPDVKRSIIGWFGPVIREGYGGTESGGISSISSEEWLAHPGSVGRPSPSFETVVVDADGKELPAGEVGILYFRDLTGRGISYRNDPAKTAAAHLEPGLFTLGDVGYVDSDGYIYITDRVTDMVISGGSNIYSAEVEAVLLNHPKVGDAALFGAPHEDLGEEPRAVVEPLDPSDPPDPAELIAFCRERIAHYKCPRKIYLGDVGRTPQGKVNKRQLRDRILAQDPPPRS